MPYLFFITYFINDQFYILSRCIRIGYCAPSNFSNDGYYCMIAFNYSRNLIVNDRITDLIAFNTSAHREAMILTIKDGYYIGINNI